MKWLAIVLFILAVGVLASVAQGATPDGCLGDCDGNGWDKSSLSVTGVCLEDGTYQFTITNDGESQQVETAWFLYSQAGTLLAAGPVLLEAGQSMVIPAVGQGTITLIVHQHPDHPGESVPQADLMCVDFGPKPTETQPPSPTPTDTPTPTPPSPTMEETPTPRPTVTPTDTPIPPTYTPPIIPDNPPPPTIMIPPVAFTPEAPSALEETEQPVYATPQIGEGPDEPVIYVDVNVVAEGKPVSHDHVCMSERPDVPQPGQTTYAWCYKTEENGYVRTSTVADGKRYQVWVRDPWSTIGDYCVMGPNAGVYDCTIEMVGYWDYLPTIRR